LFPGAFGANFGADVRPDNALITVSQPFGSYFGLIGSETVTYYFGSSFQIPEPASLVMFTLGLTVVAGLAWRQRWAKLAA
jgi:hypothetical protein